MSSIIPVGGNFHNIYIDYSKKQILLTLFGCYKKRLTLPVYKVHKVLSHINDTNDIHGCKLK